MDWRAHVRRHLPTLDIDAARETDVIEELALQLEAAYERALVGGATEAEARASAEAEVPDWNDLAVAVVRAERPVAARVLPALRPRADAPAAGGPSDGRLLADLAQDLRFAVRAFLRAPRFTVPAVVALALGIGATAAIFGVVRAVLLTPLPYAEPERVVGIWESHAARNRPRNVVAAANFLAWTERSRSFSAIGLVGPARATMVFGEEPQEVAGLAASSAVFPALGVQAALGRVYTAEEDLRGNDAVMVISHEFWQSRFGGRADVLGTPIVSNGVPRQIIGVMPPGFTVAGEKGDFLAPYGWTVEQLRAAPGRGSSYAVARLADGVSFAQAEDEMRAIASDLEREFPQRNAGWSVALVPLHEQMVEGVRPALVVLALAVAAVLLIACVNVANLLLARSTVREREMAMRTALGARRGRLVRQMLAESLVLAAAGATAGLALAWAIHRGLLVFVAGRVPVPRLDQIAMDVPVLGFTAALAVATGVTFGFIPALLASRTPISALRDGGRHGGGPRARRALATLVAIEVALSLVLLTGAGLLITSFVRLQNIDPGFRAEGLLTARVSLPGVRYDEAATTAFYADLIERVSALPGVESAAGVTFLPLAGPGMATSFYRLDRPAPADGEAPTTHVRPVTPGFFRTMGIALNAGRDLTPADRDGAPVVAVVSETLARRHLGTIDAVGHRLHVNIGRPGGMDVQVVGVVSDVAIASLDADHGFTVYLPHAQLPINLLTLVIRTAMEPTALTPSVATALRQLDPLLPLADVRTMDEVVGRTLSRQEVVAVLLAAFSALALVLASLGVYGVMAYSVAQRTQEFGVRIALGATPRSVVSMVLAQGLRPVVAGVVVGLGAAVALTRFLESQLYETPVLDPWTFGGTAALLTVVSLAASYVPARRGTRIAPVQALRSE